jgi:sorting nexin-8
MCVYLQILEQLLHAGTVEKVRNIVFMGMGEPLRNYDSVLLSLKAMTDVSLWSLKHGRITVSTVGMRNTSPPHHPLV